MWPIITNQIFEYFILSIQYIQQALQFVHKVRTNVQYIQIMNELQKIIIFKWTICEQKEAKITKHFFFLINNVLKFVSKLQQ